MIKRHLILVILLLVLGFDALGQIVEVDGSPRGGEYAMVIEGFDWGPAVTRVILYPDQEIDALSPDQFRVEVERKSNCTKLEPGVARGGRKVVEAYFSDDKGIKRSNGHFITLELKVSPELVLSNPFHYSTKDSCTGNDWVDYKLRIHDGVTGSTWSVEKNRHIPLVDEFDLKGRFTANDGTRMSYAFFDPGSDENSVPLIIWLHGGGEGGTDPRIPLLANRAANYASEEIQEYFGGAYVLVPQCPGAWMHNAQGEMTWGRENDVYNLPLMELIRNFVAEHPDIDPSRIYVGGCSNGGYMSLKLILLHPDYFAAGFISALAYKSEYLSEEELGSISQVPIWLIHSRDDRTTRPDETAVPVYQRLMALGAGNVHMSYYDHVIDISGRYGGADRHYPGHWSWIYSHTNHCRLDFDGKPVTLEGKPVTLMSWLAAQRNEH